MKAVVIKEAGKAEVADVQEPNVKPGWVKVKTTAVALNPTDWKHVALIPTPGSIVGCDFSGVVTEVGSGVTSVKPGDSIGGGVHGSNSSDLTSGGFAEYLVAKEGGFIKVPSSLEMTSAATLGIAIFTIGQSLYRSLKLPPISEPAKEKFPLLIYGGSTAMGTMAIQYAKLSGAEVITTSSPRNFDLVKSYGADVIYDYNEPGVGAKIREYTKNKLRLVLDTFSEEGAQKICAEALSSDASLEGGLHYSTLSPGKEEAFPRKDVDSRHTFAYTAIGEEFEKRGKLFKADQDEYEFAKKFWHQAQTLFEQGKLKTHPTEVRHGIEGIVQGLDDLKNGKVSGKKLVYTISG